MNTRNPSDRRSSPRPQTFTPALGEGEAELVRFAELVETYANDGRGPASIVSASGEREEIPEQLVEVLRQAARALASGRGVTIVPTATELTTQAAADFLGISRPTLVKLLERGDIPFDLVGRHRRVRLDSLLVYRDKSAQRRQSRLKKLARHAQASGPETVVGVSLQRSGEMADASASERPEPTAG